MAVETFVQRHDVLVMKNDLRLRDVLAYFIICRADLTLIKLTFLQKLMLGITADTSERLVNFDCFNLLGRPFSRKFKCLAICYGLSVCLCITKCIVDKW